MTINNSTEYVNSLWDWAVLDGCFGPGKIKPTDIDGMVERNGHFLYLETKGPGVPLKMGQEIAIKNRVRDGVSTYVVIWGNPGVPEKMQVFHPAQFKRPAVVEDCDLAMLRSACQNWYVRVSERNSRDAMNQALGVS
jgi:hypothetical protein